MNDYQQKINKILKKILITIIAICEMTDLFIRLKLSENLEQLSARQFHNMSLIKDIIKYNEKMVHKKLKIDPKFIEMNIEDIFNEFKIQSLQNFVFLSCINFERAFRDCNIHLQNNSDKPSNFIFSIDEQKILFMSIKKRKDDMMSSLFKFTQRLIMNEFKKTSNKKLVRDMKIDFKNHYFEPNCRTETIFYSNLFNRCSLSKLKMNKKLHSVLKKTFEKKNLNNLVNEYFLSKSEVSPFNDYTEFVFSDKFLKNLKKKSMNLQDAIYSFYKLEEYL